MIIAAAYLRCSDPRQDKSIEQQKVEIQRRALQDGVLIPDDLWFVDEGISGKSTKKRASYHALIRLAESQRDAMKGRNRQPLRRVERVYVWAFSRIARNMFDCLKAIATLDDADIEIVSLTENDTGDKSMRKLIRPILAWLAERYIEELSRNVSRGKHSQASKGYWPAGTTSFGYESVKCEGGCKLMVTERTRADFEVARRIFREADEGADGAKRIAERLTREGIKPPTEESHPRGFAPEAWRSRNVHNILRNPVYCGHVVHQKQIVYRNAHEAAVEDATFARVQAKRKLRGQARQEHKGNGANPLRAGLHGVLTPFLRCGTCGGSVTIVEGSKKGEGTHLYFCGNRRQSLSRCPGISVRVDKLDAVVLDAIEEKVLAPENVETLIRETAEALAASDGDVAAAERERLSTMIAELDRKIRLTATHAINGMIDESDAKAITAPLVAQRETARLQLAALPARPESLDVERVDPEVFRASVMEAWKNRPIEERREALAQVVDRVILKPGGVSIEYSLQHTAGNCAHDRIGCIIQPRFP